MLAALAKDYALVESTFAEASAVLGYDLWALVQAGPQESLNLTECTQPLLLTASVAIWRIWQQQQGHQPQLLAGHSLGEWSALVCAQVLAFDDAVKLVQLRGKYMQEAVPAGLGSMAAIIGLADEAIITICEQAAEDQVVSAVNFNSPGQVVIAGHASAVDRACALCTEQGARRAMVLPVSAPFHSSLLRPAADRLAADIEDIVFYQPVIPVIHNVHAKIADNPLLIKQLMIEQIYHPVLWVDCVKAIAAAGVTHVFECGPGKVLSGLSKRIDRNLLSMTTEAPDDLLAALAVGR
ncbi:MAG: ACP S-malonyltransferase [Cellvibrionaceae bacterium]|nr:ACP S-malonyltransferase [Cellvibrionaceae bacterium]